jgi:hypothetical protein
MDQQHSTAHTRLKKYAETHAKTIINNRCIIKLHKNKIIACRLSAKVNNKGSIYSTPCKKKSKNKTRRQKNIHHVSEL